MFYINISELDNFRISDKEKKKVIDRIVKGFEAWNNLPNVCVKFTYLGLTTKAKYKPGDKVNVVHFSMDEAEFKKVQKRVKDADALAVTYKGGDEFDMIINGEGFLGMGRNGLYINFPGSMANDLQTATVHEAGHALGLGHSSKKDSAMRKTLPRRKRHTPSADDIDEARKLYPCPKKSQDSRTSYREDDASFRDAAGRVDEAYATHETGTDKHIVYDIDVDPDISVGDSDVVNPAPDILDDDAADADDHD